MIRRRSSPRSADAADVPARRLEDRQPRVHRRRAHDPRRLELPRRRPTRRRACALPRAQPQAGAAAEGGRHRRRTAPPRVHGIDTTGWWERQLALSLLGIMVALGWEKALGDDAELRWWEARSPKAPPSSNRAKTISKTLHASELDDLAGPVFGFGGRCVVARPQLRVMAWAEMTPSVARRRSSRSAGRSESTASTIIAAAPVGDWPTRKSAMLIAASPSERGDGADHSRPVLVAHDQHRCGSAASRWRGRRP